MIDEKLEAAAQELYESNENRVKPSWDQLGDATKSVWRAYVQKDPSWPFKYSVPAGWLQPTSPAASAPAPAPAPAPALAPAPAPAPEPPPPTRPLTLKEKLAMKGLK